MKNYFTQYSTRLFTPNLLFFVGLLAFGTVVNAQQPETQPTPATRLEAAEGLTGRVLIENYGFIGRKAASPGGSSVVVEALNIEDVQNHSTWSGFVITVKEVGSVIKEKRAYVDLDEIDSIMKAIDYMVKVDGSQFKLGRFDAHYRTRGSMDLDIHGERNGIRASVSAGELSTATADFSLNEFADVRDLIDAARKKLEELKP